MRNKCRKVVDVQMAVMNALPSIVLRVEKGDEINKVLKSCGLRYMDYWKYCPAPEREKISNTLNQLGWRQRRRQ
jgi:hypothetical protein